MVAVDGPAFDALVFLVVVVLTQPEGEGLVDLVQGGLGLDVDQEALAYGAEETFDLSA